MIRRALENFSLFGFGVIGTLVLYGGLVHFHLAQPFQTLVPGLVVMALGGVTFTVAVRTWLDRRMESIKAGRS